MKWGWNPIDNLSNIVNGVYDGITNGWNDYTGVTASQMSAKASKENTEKQLAWERERATSAHQWEVQDLKNAGLNPVLSAGGSGAVTGGISPQMPDFSQYKGFGAIIPLLSQFYDNSLKTSNSAKAVAEADLANTKSFTEKTQQILNLYNSNLIDEKTAGQAIENEINEINRQWLPWEKGVGMATDVVRSVTPIVLGGNMIRSVGNSAKSITDKLNKIEKGIKKPTLKARPLEIKKPKKEWQLDRSNGNPKNDWIFKKDVKINKKTGEILPRKL